MDILEELHRSVDSRATPEAVCALILRALDARLTGAERRVLTRAAESRPAFFSAMNDDLETPPPALHKVTVLGELLMGKELDDAVTSQLAADPWVLLGQVETIRVGLGWEPDTGWLTAKEFRRRGGGLSRRRYNRLRRHLQRTAVRAMRLQHQILLCQMTRVARSGLAYAITLAEMRGDVDGACFVAYWVAHRNRRHTVTFCGRDTPLDTVAGMLLERCVRRAGATDWPMLARAYPDPVVLARLDEQGRGELMAQWFGFVQLGASILGELYEAWPAVRVEPVLPASVWADRPGLMPAHVANPPVRKAVDLNKMTFGGGVDSSTWNLVAGAYNAARAGWITCLAGSEALDLLDAVCPGKAMPLIPADHRSNGPDQQIYVWAELPRPWQVLFDDGVACNAARIEHECSVEGVDPHATGWTPPRQHAGQWQPTLELAHGIESTDPRWAGLLRRAGYLPGEPVATRP